ncbi:MAG: N-acetyltransferase [Sandaracinus sp.]|nr:N-acetyltransferase [Sandaracinus sp.]
MTIVRAGLGDRDALVALLAEAFADDPFIGWLVGGDPRRVRRYVRLVLERLTLPHGTVWTDANRRSVACWAPPGGWDLALGDQLRLLPALTRALGFGRLGPAARASARIEVGRPERHWYLALVATAPEARGQGLGRAVMAPALAEAAAEGVPALLETSAPANLAFYRSQGFAVTRELPPEEGSPPVWSMRRRA